MLCITIIWVTAGTCKPTVSQSKQFTTYLWEKQFKFIHLVFRHCQLLPLHHKLQLHQDPTVQKYTTSSCHTNTSLPSYPALTLCLQRRGSVFVNENAKRITDRRRIKEALFFCFFFLNYMSCLWYWPWRCLGFPLTSAHRRLRAAWEGERVKWMVRVRRMQWLTSANTPNMRFWQEASSCKHTWFQVSFRCDPKDRNKPHLNFTTASFSALLRWIKAESCLKYEPDSSVMKTCCWIDQHKAAYNF